MKFQIIAVICAVVIATLFFAPGFSRLQQFLVLLGQFECCACWVGLMEEEEGLGVQLGPFPFLGVGGAVVT